MVTKAHHALLLAYLVRRWRAAFSGERARIEEAVAHYGRQRGARMARRAQADGEALDMPAYFAYSEWTPIPGESHGEMDGCNGAQVDRVMGCPWCAVWAREGMLEEGAHYCRQVDRAILEGFNPRLRLQVTQLASLGADCCEFLWLDMPATAKAQARVDALRQRVGASAARDWDYHCAHLLDAFARDLRRLHGPAGDACAQGALADLGQRCGDAVVDTIVHSWQTENFV